MPISDGWTVDPFGGEIRDGRVWGLGSGDAKGQIVAMLGAIEALVRPGTPIQGDLKQHRRWMSEGVGADLPDRPLSAAELSNINALARPGMKHAKTAAMEWTATSKVVTWTGYRPTHVTGL